MIVQADDALIDAAKRLEDAACHLEALNYPFYAATASWLGRAVRELRRETVNISENEK